MTTCEAYNLPTLEKLDYGMKKGEIAIQVAN